MTEEHFSATIKQLDPKDPLQLRWLTLFTLLSDTGAQLGEILNSRSKKLTFKIDLSGSEVRAGRNG